MARTWCALLLSSLLGFAGATATTAGAAVPPDQPTPEQSAAPTATPDPSAKPPAGIVPTTATLAQVLALYRASEGKATSDFKTYRETDTIAAFGETGTYSEIDSGDDYIETTQLGPSRTSGGSYHGQRWRQNDNGYTRLVSGIHEEEEHSSDALARSIRGENLASVKLLGEVASPVHAYIVEVNPEQGRHEWLFIDVATGRLVRTEESRVGHRVVWTYDDFRTTDGIVTPWHQHLFDGFAGNDVDWRITQLAYGMPVAASDVAIPPTKSPLRFPSGVTRVRLPARIEDGVIIVRLVINGRGLDFQLDSGSSGIAIDDDVARQLGLRTYGQSTHTVAGTFQSSSAIILQMQIGALTMDDVKVSCLPFTYDPDFETKIVGLLGYDFLAGAVVKVDYYDGTVDAFEPSSFAPPPGEVFALPMKLDDSVPTIDATVDDSSADNFIVDTGSTFVLVFQTFARSHAAELPPVSYTIANKTYYPMLTAQGVGGFFSLQPAIVDRFKAGAGVENLQVFDVVDAVADFQGEDDDGLLGYEFLRLFDVYLDYKDSVLLLQPNPSFAAHERGF